MFPEGTRHGGSDLLPFKKGAFHVAIASQTAILPVVVSRYHFLDSERHVFDKGNLFRINFVITLLNYSFAYCLWIAVYLKPIRILFSVKMIKGVVDKRQSKALTIINR